MSATLIALLLLAQQPQPVATRFCGPAIGRTMVDQSRAVEFCHGGHGLVGIDRLEAIGTVLIVTLSQAGERAFTSRLDAEFVLSAWVTAWHAIHKGATTTVIAAIGNKELVRAIRTPRVRLAIQWTRRGP